MGFNQVDLVRELPQVGAEPNQNRLMSSLDVRIQMVTIFLSVILLSVSVTELLCCFKIIQDVASLAEWKFLLYYLLSEQFPSITIACFFKTDIQEGNEAINEVEGLYSGQSREGKEKKMRRSHLRTQSPSHSEYQNMAVNEIYQEKYDSEDSEYGNFNPNLYAHKRNTSEAFERSGMNYRNQHS